MACERVSSPKVLAVGGRLFDGYFPLTASLSSPRFDEPAVEAQVLRLRLRQEFRTSPNPGGPFVKPLPRPTPLLLKRLL